MKRSLLLITLFLSSVWPFGKSIAALENDDYGDDITSQFADYCGDLSRSGLTDEYYTCLENLADEQVREELMSRGILEHENVAGSNYCDEPPIDDK